MFLLWHPSLTAINLSYTFPIPETSATALCGTTGTYISYNHIFFHLMISHAFVISLRCCAEAETLILVPVGCAWNLPFIRSIRIIAHISSHFNGDPCLPCTVVGTFSGRCLWQSFEPESIWCGSFQVWIVSESGEGEGSRDFRMFN